MAWFDLDEETAETTTTEKAIPLNRLVARSTDEEAVPLTKLRSVGEFINAAPPRTMGEEFSVGLDRGEDQLRGLGYGLVGLAADALGVEAGADWGYDNYRQAMEEAASKEATVTDPFTEIGSFSDAGRYAVGLIGEQIPQLITSIAGGGVGGFVGKSLAKKMVANEVLKRVAAGATATAAEREIAEEATKSILRKAAMAKADEAASTGLGASVAGQTAREGLEQGFRSGAYTGAYLANFGQIAGGTYGQIRDETGEGGTGAVLSAVGTAVPGAALDTLSEIFIASRPIQSLRPFARGVESKALGMSLPARAGFGAAKGVAGGAAIEGPTEYIQTGLEQAAVGMADPEQTVGQRLAAPGAERERQLAAAAGATVGGLLGGGAGTLEVLAPRTKAKLDEVGAPADDRFEQGTDAATTTDGGPRTIAGNWLDEVDVDGLKLRYNPDANIWAALNPPEVEGLGPAVATELSNAPVALVNLGTRKGAALAARAQDALSAFRGEAEPEQQNLPQAAEETEDDGTELVPVETMMARPPGRQGVGGARTPVLTEAARPGATIEFNGRRGVVTSSRTNLPGKDSTLPGRSIFLTADFGDGPADIPIGQVQNVRVISEQQLAKEAETEAEIERLQNELDDESITEEDRRNRAEIISNLRARLLSPTASGIAFQDGPAGFTVGATEPIAEFKTRRKAMSEEQRRREQEAQTALDGTAVSGMRTGDKVSVLLGDEMVPAMFVARNANGNARFKLEEDGSRIELTPAQFKNVGFRIENPAELSDEADFNRQLREAKTPEELARLTGGFLPAGGSHKVKVKTPGGDSDLTYRVRYMFQTSRKAKPRLTGEAEAEAETVPGYFATPAELGGPTREQGEAAVQRELTRGLAEGAAATEGLTVGGPASGGGQVGGIPYQFIGGDTDTFNEIWGRGAQGQLVMKRPLFAKFELLVEPTPAKPDFDEAYSRAFQEEQAKVLSGDFYTGPQGEAVPVQKSQRQIQKEMEMARERATERAQKEVAGNQANFNTSLTRLKKDMLRSMDTGHVVTITPETVQEMEGRVGSEELLNILRADPDVNIDMRVPLDPTGKPTGSAVPTVVSLVWRGTDGKQAPYTFTQGSKPVRGGLAQDPNDLEAVASGSPMTPQERDKERELQTKEREAEGTLMARQENERRLLRTAIRGERSGLNLLQQRANRVTGRREERQALESEINELRGLLVKADAPAPASQTEAITARQKELNDENDKSARSDMRLRKQIRETDEELAKKRTASLKDTNSVAYRSRMSGDLSQLMTQRTALEGRLRESKNARNRRNAEIRKLTEQAKAVTAQEKQEAASRKAAAQRERRQLKKQLADREKALSNFVIDEKPVQELQKAQEKVRQLESRVEPLEAKLAKERLEFQRGLKSYNPAQFSELRGPGSFAKIYQTDPERSVQSERKRLDAQTLEAQRTQEMQEALQNLPEADRVLIGEVIGMMTSVFPDANFYANRDRIMMAAQRGLSQPLGETEYEQVLGTAQNLAYNSAISSFLRVLDARRQRGGAPSQIDPAEQARLAKAFVSELGAVVRERLASQARRSPSEDRLAARLEAASLGVPDEDVQAVFDANPEAALELIDEYRRKPTRDVTTKSGKRGQLDPTQLRGLWTRLHAIVESKTESLTAGAPGRKARARAARATGAIKKSDLAAAKKRVQEKLGKGDKNKTEREARLFENMVAVLGDFYAGTPGTRGFNPLTVATQAVDAARKRAETARANRVDQSTQYGTNPDIFGSREGEPTQMTQAEAQDLQAQMDAVKTDPASKLTGSGSGTTPRMVIVREAADYLRNQIPPEEAAIVYKVSGLAYNKEKRRIWYGDETGARLKQFEEALADLNELDDVSEADRAIAEKHFDYLRDIPNLPPRQEPTNETETIQLRTTPTREAGVLDRGTAPGLRGSSQARRDNRLRFAVAPSPVSGTGLDPSSYGDSELPRADAVSESLGGQLGFDAPRGLPSAGQPDAERSGSVPRPADGPTAGPRVQRRLSAGEVRRLAPQAERFYVEAFTDKDLNALPDEEIGRIYSAIQTEAKGAETTLAAGGNVIAQTPQPMADLLSSQNGFELLTGMAAEARQQQLNRERVANLRKNIGALAEARAFAGTTKFLETAANDPKMPEQLRLLAKELTRLNSRVDWDDNVATQIAAFGRNYTDRPITEKEIEKRVKVGAKDKKPVFIFKIGGQRQEVPVPSRKADALEIQEKIYEAVRQDIAMSNVVPWGGRAVNIGSEGAFSIYLNLNAVHDRPGGSVATLIHEYEHVVLGAKLDGEINLNPVETAALERLENMRRAAVTAAAKERGIAGEFDAVNAQLVEISGQEANQTLRALTNLQEFIIEATGNPAVFKLLADLGFAKGDGTQAQFTGALRDLWNSVAELEAGVKMAPDSPLARAFTDSYMLTYASLGNPDKEYNVGFSGPTSKFTAPQIIKNALVDELDAALLQERFIRDQLEARNLAGTSADRNALAQEFSTLRAEAAKKGAAREAELARGRTPTRAPRANLPDLSRTPTPAPAPAPATTTETKVETPTGTTGTGTTGQRTTANEEQPELTDEQAEEQQVNRDDALARMALAVTEQEFVAAFNAARQNNVELPDVDPVTLYYVTRANAARQLGLTQLTSPNAEEQAALATSQNVEREISGLIAQLPDPNEPVFGTPSAERQASDARRAELGAALRAVQIQGVRRKQPRRDFLFTAAEYEELIAQNEARGNTEAAAQLRAELEDRKKSDAAIADAEKAAAKQRERDQKKAEREQAKAQTKVDDQKGAATAQRFGLTPKPKAEPKPPKAKKEEPKPTDAEIEADFNAAVDSLNWGPWRQIQTGDGPKWVREAQVAKDNTTVWKNWKTGNKENFLARGLRMDRPTGAKRWNAQQFSTPSGVPDPESDIPPDQRPDFGVVLPVDDDTDYLEEPDPTAKLSLGGTLTRIFRDQVVETPTGGTFVLPKLISAVAPTSDRRITDLDQQKRGAMEAEASRATKLLRDLRGLMRQAARNGLQIKPQVITTAIGSLENPLTPEQRENVRVVRLTDPEAASVLEDRYRRENKEAFREKQNAARASLPKEMRSVVVQMSDHIASLSAALKKVGLLTDDLVLEIDANLGMYLTRVYRAFTDPEWEEKVRKMPEVMANARRVVRQRLVNDKAEAMRDDEAEKGRVLSREEARRMANSSVAAAQVEAEISRLLADAKPVAKKILSGRIMGQKDLGILKRRGNIEPEIQALLGVYDDPETSYGKTVLKVSSLIHNQIFLNDLKTLGLSEGWFYEAPKITQFGDEYVVTKNGEELFRSDNFDDAREYQNSLPEDDIPPGFVKIAAQGNEKLAPMDGVYGMPEVVAGLYEMFPLVDQQLPAALNLMGKATGFTMAMATVASAQGQSRNYQSGWLKYISTGNIFGGTGPIKKAHKLAWVDFSNRYPDDAKGRTKLREEIEDAIKRGVFGESVSVNMINDLVDSYAKLGSAAKQADTEWEKRYDAFVRQPVKRTWDFAQGLYTMSDNIFRGMVYFAEIDNYRKIYPKMSDDALKDKAAKISRDIYWTYSQAPKWVQDLKRGPGLVIAPFITFTTEVVRTLINTGRLAHEEWTEGRRTGNAELTKLAMRRVAGMSIAMLAPAIVGSTLMSLFGFSAEDEEDLRKFLPDWQKNNQLLILGRNGNKISFVDVSFLDPHEYFKKPVKAFFRAISGAEDPQEAIVKGAVSVGRELLDPFMSEQLFAGAVMDVARNIDATGRRIYNPQDTTDNIIEAVGRHVGNAFVPGTARSVYRIGMGATGTVTESGRSYDPVQEMSALVAGQRVNQIDLVQSLGFKASEFNRNKRDATALFNRVALNSGEVNPGDVTDAWTRANIAHLRLARGFREVYKSIRRLGLSDAAATERLRAMGVTRDDIERARAGIYEPFNPSGEARKDMRPERLRELEEAIRQAQAEQI